MYLVAIKSMLETVRKRVFYESILARKSFQFSKGFSRFLIDFKTF